MEDERKSDLDEEHTGRLIFSRTLGVKLRDCGEVLESDPDLKYVSNC